MSESDVKRGRGRPVVYFGELKAHIVSLISVLGLTNTRKVLNANGAVLTSYEKKFGVTRDRALVTKGLGISMLTLCKMAKREGVAVKRGRPVTKVAEAA